MFKYVKQLNAHCAAPEITTCYIDSVDPVNAGDVMFHDSYGLTHEGNDSTHSGMKYLVLEDFTPDPSNLNPRKLKALAILPGMVFETESHDSVYYVGQKFLLEPSESGKGYKGISKTEGNGARIFKFFTEGNKCWVELAW